MSNSHYSPRIPDQCVISIPGQRKTHEYNIVLYTRIIVKLPTRQSYIQTPILFHSNQTSQLIYCAFFCAAGPISLSKAPYETSRLEIALRPTPRIERSRTVTKRPMKRPMDSVSEKNFELGKIMVTNLE